jgi:diaminopimelate decarboxylase
MMTMINYLGDKEILSLLNKYGSPLYIYDENILRMRCKEMHNLLKYKNFRVNYSAKANSNLELLRIIESEDIDVDAMSPGEIFLEKSAGFTSDRIFYIGNNVSGEEMKYAIENNIVVSVDSLSQLELMGKINQGGNVAIRFNPGLGAGHNDKVITGGKNTKFGVQKEFISEVKEILARYELNLVGLDHHIGSLFLEETTYIEAMKSLFEVANNFENLKFIDLGGGFGVPYKNSETRLDLEVMSTKMHEVVNAFVSTYSNKDIIIKIEPGRYIVAECGVLLGTVHSVKDNYGKKYIGTDLGFNVLARPVMYDSYHEVSIVKNKDDLFENEIVNVVGNICESGDILAKDRYLPKITEGDAIIVYNAGAYGFSMASNYNCRLKPAEVLIASDGTDRLIRRRDEIDDLMRNFI